MSGFHGSRPLFFNVFLPPCAAHLRLVGSAPSSCTFLVFDWNLLHLASNLSRTSSDKHIYRNLICILQNVSWSESVWIQRLRRKSMKVESGSWNRSQQHDWFTPIVISYNNTSGCIAHNPVSMQLLNWVILAYCWGGGWGGGGVTWPCGAFSIPAHSEQMQQSFLLI